MSGRVPRGKAVVWLVALGGLVYLGHASLYGGWINDDAGISFTYARNFADIDSFAVRQNPHNEPDRFENLFP